VFGKQIDRPAALFLNLGNGVSDHVERFVSTHFVLLTLSKQILP
jgi:hypothetical protein